MCRWLAYSGSPILMKEVLYGGTHSLVDQSLHSRLGAEMTNGDGFGVGWYGAPDTPGVFHSTEPELYPEVVDACEEEGGVPSRLTKTEAGDGRQEGTPCQMFAGSPSGRTTRVGSRSMISRGRERVG